jgi:DNA-binding MarR family transcriptional regulator
VLPGHPAPVLTTVRGDLGGHNHADELARARDPLTTIRSEDDGEDSSEVAVREVGERIFVAWRELRRGAGMSALRDVLYGTGGDALDPAQVDALELLLERDAWRMSDLAAALYIDASTATRTIDRLVAAGLAVRQPASDDARGIVVSATPTGRRRCVRIRRGRQVLVWEFIEEFSGDERERLAVLMERLVAGVNRRAGRPSVTRAEPPARSSVGPASTTDDRRVTREAAT